MSNWINIAHKKPHIGQYVLVFLPDDYEPRMEVAQYSNNNEWYINDSYNNFVLDKHIRFWQPLPPFPNSTKEELSAIMALKWTADSQCLCSMGCPRCDAIEALNEMGITI
jgi:hypothetical protein